jgi:AcrR family transcriptional regulator
VGEIKQAARTLLVREGQQAVTLRAIARDMGVTAPALYRYYPSLERLVGGLIADLYHELSDALEAARDAAPDDPSARLHAVCREFRRWSVAHPAEFALMFGSRIGTPTEEDRGEAQEAGMRLARVFGALFAMAWRESPFPVPADDEIDPALATQFAVAGPQLLAGLPAGALQIFLSCWIRLYGIVALEVFRHVDFALTDVEPMFEAELADVARRLGLPFLPRSG